MLVNEHFTTALPWVTGHLQTIADRLTRPRHDLRSAGREVRLLVELPDGTGDVLAVRIHRPLSASPGRPLVLVVHGMGGTIDSTYLRACALGLLRSGYVVARVDLRGVGDSAERSRLLYHGGRTADLRAVLRALRDEPGIEGLALIGFSLGGNAVIKLLGEPFEGLPIRGGVAVSAPLDLAAGAEHIHHIALGLYERFLVMKLRYDASGPGIALTPEQRERLGQVGSITEFDDLITAKHNGWRDAAQYYALNSSAQFLHTISVPALVIHALDDPLIPVGSYAAIDWEGLARTTPVRRAITRHGGHVGFHEHGAELPWFVRRAVAHLDSL